MPPLRFEKILISDERYESAGVFDVNNDGVLDIVSGAYWYPGPKFDKKCKIANLPPFENEYFDDFSTIPMDINGDGYLDFVTGGWWGKTLRWYENPQGDPSKQWTEHVIAEVGSIETTRAWDVDGDGQIEIVPNTPGAPLRFYKLITDRNGRGTGTFSEHVVRDQPQGHGFGFGDINGDGRGDFVLSKGWCEAPEDPIHGEWIFHEEFDLGKRASCPILVVDVNGDGLNDLIVGNGHDYGLDWLEQRIEGGKRTWIRHPIDPFNGQYHDLWWVDIDGDGQCELVTGKRYRAHCGKDPSAYDPVGLYYFKWTGENFAKQVIDFGPIRQGKGCGIFFQVADIDGDGRLDIVAPGKDGLYLFRNLGYAENMGDF
ncbi:MAG: VCBS repeat-containing protein [Phycisphaerae bacterium]|nr:VCBS repeat-containing protein [Phycisphaerae bacterium]